MHDMQQAEAGAESMIGDVVVRLIGIAYASDSELFRGQRIGA